ncbi:growth factor receptor domain-containing protein [Coniophora puteana RWD-64-598 SS2]|uniref:Growth factor receptor domain-containing protein n=1 Tax=Coniophora puteana (strain RWD-64-598) TaxID=741705 RepID=A0A5M3N2J6_CONPW|nr:growth factor receptor domain-containing protein [Coniophora puteana RWD-64-598 SS2]EIW85609.1 growth factor receptor domain-containing protein [Coniophora puteana RWD-64-598 SS2]
MLSVLFTAFFAFSASVAAQNVSVVCIAGQCLEGFTNTTIGATLSAPGAQTDVILLPDTYSSTSNPELLHNLLTASSASLSPATGFSNSSGQSSVSLPLTLALQPGMAIYPQALYSGQAQFSTLPSTPQTNTSIPFSASSLSLAPNVWAAVSAGSSSTRVILWSSVPDTAQLPTTASGSLALLDMQSASCSPQCSGNGVCSASGTCTCPAGFTGSSCESCVSGHFGPQCAACPAGCTECDDGINGSGVCAAFAVSDPPASCNCVNGECGSNGQCTCLPGWTAASNGTQCAQCASGYFLDSSGNCEICQLGCAECSDGTGDCISCASGFTQDANDKTKCDSTGQTTSSGTACPDGSFSAGSSCQACSPSCQTCHGSTSNDCIICATGTYSLGGNCVQTNSGGVCAGTSMIANNNKHECDTCPSKCTSCQISSFSAASTINQAQCTGCLPGYVLSQGQCVESCPSGTFLSPTDNLTCTACSSSCGTCAGSASFCLTCTNNQIAANGTCVNTCPSNTFSASGRCIACHPDCATCAGGSFDQCTSCAKTLPVLTSGRCLATCSQNQYLDGTSAACEACDSSCASCSGPGPNACLACSSSSNVLRGGACVAANCTGGAGVVSGLGACLSELVLVPSNTSSGGSSAPLPSITGISSPTVVSSSSGRLQWWEILLMALGCAFIFLVVVMCWRRRARKQRQKATAAFASAKQLDRKEGWRWKLIRFGERLMGGGGGDAQKHADAGEIALWKMRAAEEARHNQYREREMEKMMMSGGGGYAHSHSHAGSSRGPSPLPSLYEGRHGHDGTKEWYDEAFEREYDAPPNDHRFSSHSVFSQVTGVPRSGPEPRQPVRTNPLTSRFSTTTLGTSSGVSRSAGERNKSKRKTPSPRAPSVAQEYAMSVRKGSPSPRLLQKPLVPTHTGDSGSRNPFRQ